MPGPAGEPTFFATPEAFRRWLDEHHATERELLVGFYKTGSGRPSRTWPESVDEALCHGWIDGVRRRIDEESYSIRFTPRKAGSMWSLRNVGRVEALRAEGRMKPAGLAAYAARREDKTGVYSFEKSLAELFPEHEARLRADARAWSGWNALPPSYRRTVAHWLASAKKDETRERRFGELVEASRAGIKVKPFRRAGE